MTIATAPDQIDIQPLLLNVTNTRLTVTGEQFDRLCIDNPDLRLELTPDLKLIVMAPTGGESGKKNGVAELMYDIAIESKNNKKQ
jgi:Uma2 family endonuclease